MARTLEWYRAKAEALATAWRRREPPTKHGIALALSMAIHETNAGDAWPGESNWGATTLRSLTAQERQLLSSLGIVATIGAGHVEAAARAQQALENAGLAPDNGVIHCDSTTDTKGVHPYFVYFFKGKDDVDGADYFLKLLMDGKPARAVLDNPNAGPFELAAAAYARGYFFGFKPHQKYKTAGPDGVMGTADDVEHDGNAENIQAYGAALAGIWPAVTAALKDWDSEGGPIIATPEPLPALNLVNPIHQWRALQLLGCVRPFPPAPPFTTHRFAATVGFYQGGTLKADDSGELLDVDGDCGPDTRATLRRDLTALGIAVL